MTMYQPGEGSDKMDVHLYSVHCGSCPKQKKMHSSCLQKTDPWANNLPEMGVLEGDFKGDLWVAVTLREKGPPYSLK